MAGGVQETAQRQWGNYQWSCCSGTFGKLRPQIIQLCRSTRPGSEFSKVCPNHPKIVKSIGSDFERRLCCCLFSEMWSRAIIRPAWSTMCYWHSVSRVKRRPTTVDTPNTRQRTFTIVWKMEKHRFPGHTVKMVRPKTKTTTRMWLSAARLDPLGRAANATNNHRHRRTNHYFLHHKRRMWILILPQLT